jgi:hypothetical protein
MQLSAQASVRTSPHAFDIGHVQGLMFQELGRPGHTAESVLAAGAAASRGEKNRRQRRRQRWFGPGPDHKKVSHEAHAVMRPLLCELSNYCDAKGMCSAIHTPTHHGLDLPDTQPKASQ